MCLDWIWPTACAGCDRPLAGRLCVECAANRPAATAPPAGLDFATAWAPYAGPIGRAVRRTKYVPDRDLGVLLSVRAAEALGPLMVDEAAWVPVPSPWDRRLWRGFSLPHLFVRELNRCRPQPIADVLAIGRGPRQAGIATWDRRANVAGRLRITGSVPPRVVLVDDVVTTGATATACADLLRLEGAKHVGIVALCDARSR